MCEMLAMSTRHAAQVTVSPQALGPANFLYADAEVLFAHGHRRILPASGRIEPPGLFRLAQSSRTVEQCSPAQGVAGEPDLQAVTLIASVPLDDHARRPFAESEVAGVSARVVTQRRPAC